MKGAVIVRFSLDGEMEYHVFGEDVRLFIVDERCPSDRVYEWLSRAPIEDLRRMIPGGASRLDRRGTRATPPSLPASTR